MKIAQIAPLAESVPPKLYGGTERIVSFLTEELVRQNHDVTLFASADSQTNARLVPVCEMALRLSSPPVVDSVAHYIRLVELVLKQAHEFDVLHFHIDYLHFPLTRRQSVPAVTTLHGKLTIPELVPLYREYSDVPVVSISDSQRQPLPWINWIGTVYHGLPEGLYHFRDRPGDYLAFLGRVCPEKRPDRAIEIAERAGVQLKIAAKVDEADKTYFKKEIEPLLKSSSSVEFIGEINDQEKNEFLGNALAFLFPIDWPEPFGLVLIEALACGTPIIAFRNGSVPEIVEHGRTGFIVDSLEEAITAVQNVGRIDRRACRAAFDERFTARRMAQDYLDIYEKIGLGKCGDKPCAIAGKAITVSHPVKKKGARDNHSDDPKDWSARADTSARNSKIEF
jgi:glycosyltransferase involved in cell wall biosynthesis